MLAALMMPCMHVARKCGTFQASLEPACSACQPGILSADCSVRQAVQAMQSQQSTLAECFRLYILLARVLKNAAVSERLPKEFVEHAFAVYNRRFREMATPLVKLALYLHPGYRLVGSGDIMALRQEVSYSCHHCETI